MLLGHDALWSAIRSPNLSDRLIVEPLLDDEQVGPSSVDLRLGTEFIEERRLAQEAIDPFADWPSSPALRQDRVVIPFGNHLALHPGQFVLGSSLEFIRLPTYLAGQVLGRSSWGRVGLIVATAVTVQPGFAGCLTLELVNMGTVPIAIYPGLRVAQLMVFKLEGRGDYQTGVEKYDNPLGPESTKVGWEAKELELIRQVADRMTS